MRGGGRAVAFLPLKGEEGLKAPRIKSTCESERNKQNWGSTKGMHNRQPFWRRGGGEIGGIVSG